VETCKGIRIAKEGSLQDKRKEGKKEEDKRQKKSFMHVVNPSKVCPG